MTIVDTKYTQVSNVWSHKHHIKITCKLSQGLLEAHIMLNASSSGLLITAT